MVPLYTVASTPLALLIYAMSETCADDIVYVCMQLWDMMAKEEKTREPKFLWRYPVFTLGSPDCVFKLLSPALADIDTWPPGTAVNLNIYQERLGLLVASLAKPLLESLVSVWYCK